VWERFSTAIKIDKIPYSTFEVGRSMFDVEAFKPTLHGHNAIRNDQQVSA
jgi:hypothetical protein